jgi:hypothetical protein
MGHFDAEVRVTEETGDVLLKPGNMACSAVYVGSRHAFSGVLYYFYCGTGLD